MPHKALVLFSGGLDSLLAVKILQETGQEVEAVHLRLPFTRSVSRAGIEAVRASIAQTGAMLHVLEPGEDLAEMVAQPKFGHGKQFNPCQDCRIYQLRKAAGLMREIGADYLATGEVVGQRPMSQRREALFITDREAGLKGRVLRPLSAKLLPPTIPEERGWVNRELLLDLGGRGRSVQEALAGNWGLSYPSPAGGCLLTYRESADRYRNLLELPGGVPLADIPLVGLGRHFRLGPGTSIVVGRREEENRKIAHIFRRRPIDRVLMQAAGVPGPLTLVLGKPDPADLERAAAITARYADLAGPGPAAVKILAVRNGHSERERFEVRPAVEPDLARWRI